MRATTHSLTDIDISQEAAPYYGTLTSGNVPRGLLRAHSSTTPGPSGRGGLLRVDHADMHSDVRPRRFRMKLCPGTACSPTFFKENFVSLITLIPGSAQHPIGLVGSPSDDRTARARQALPAGDRAESVRVWLAAR